MTMNTWTLETFWKDGRWWWPVSAFVRVPFIAEAFLGDGQTAFTRFSRAA